MPDEPFDDIMKEVNPHLDPENDEEELFDTFPVTDAADKEILMHREVHFGGKFDFMLDYYYSGGKGVNPGFEIKRIEEMKFIEESSQENLAPVLLSGADAEKIAHARDVYKKLRALYEDEQPESRIPRLIADLILSEEVEGETEIEAILSEGKKMIPYLLDLLRSEEFHDPLFPGYGQAPFLAAKTLGLIGEEKAIVSLFESIGRGDFENEKMILKALKNVGEPAKEFLLKVVSARPYSEMNERAALALIEFQGDPAVAEKCLSLLEDPEVFMHDSLATYLILACEELKTEDQKKRFTSIAENSRLPSHLKKDMEAVIHSWES